MKKIFGIGQITKRVSKCILVIGVFDGVHIGHQKLIEQAKKRADQIGSKVVVMTFAPHPVHVLRPEKFLPLIVPLNRRLELLESYGIDATLVVKFTKRFAKISAESFIKRYIADKIKPTEIIVGDDFKFGSDRRGGLEFFKAQGARYGFNVAPVKCVKKKTSKIGSTMIRECIINGDLKEASRYLGRSVAVIGVVKKGYARGRKLGFPTANIYPTDVLLPPVAAYAVHIKLGTKVYDGMANVGYRPSFKQKDKKKNLEVHIFDFKRSIYGQVITVQFIQKIRSEKIFSSKEELITQLKVDEGKVRRIL
ncbi:MAG: riboflavin kinase/FMN adenylyltransferase, partial [Candidatus Omnitrophota bacterium]